MEKTERQKMADISMSELIELEKEATASLDGIELNNKTMQRPQENNPTLNVDASVKVVVSDNHLEANMCVFSPQFSGKDITVEAMRQALKDEHVVYGIDEELLEEIAANKLYDKIFTVASGYAAVDGENGRVKNLFDTDKKLVPRKLEDGSVDYRDLGLIVNVRVNDLICEIVPETQGEEGMNALLEYVSECVGFRPDGYMLIDLNVFVELVDLMGGVRFDVPCDMYYNDPTQDLYINLTAGEQTLNGEQAMGLVRFRSGYAMADLQRVSVQRDFLSAAMHQWLSVKNLLRLPKALKLLMDNTFTDLSMENLLWLGESVLLCGTGDMQMMTIPNYLSDGGEYVIINGNELLPIINESFNPYEKDVTWDDLYIAY